MVKMLAWLHWGPLSTAAAFCSRRSVSRSVGSTETMNSWNLQPIRQCLNNKARDAFNYLRWFELALALDKGF